MCPDSRAGLAQGALRADGRLACCSATRVGLTAASSQHGGLNWVMCTCFVSKSRSSGCRGIAHLGLVVRTAPILLHGDATDSTPGSQHPSHKSRQSLDAQRGLHIKRQLNLQQPHGPCSRQVAALPSTCGKGSRLNVRTVLQSPQRHSAWHHVSQPNLSPAWSSNAQRIHRRSAGAGCKAQTPKRLLKAGLAAMSPVLKKDTHSRGGLEALPPQVAQRWGQLRLQRKDLGDILCYLQVHAFVYARLASLP